MKHKIVSVLIFSIMICLITGCQKKNHLLLKQDVFTIELGNPIQKEASYYLDKEVMEEEKDNIFNEAVFSVDTCEDDFIYKYGLVYEKEGTYQASIQYKEQTLDFEIVIKDTRAPVILGNNEDELEVFDYNDVYDYDIDGDVVSVSDIAGHQSSKLIHQEIKESIQLDVPYYNQNDVNSPNGCETTSLYMALKYENQIDSDLASFIKNEPYDVNPYYGFSGDPFGICQKTDDYYTIFPTPLVTYGSQYASCQDISGSSLTDIKAYLSQDCPVLVWVTGRFQEPIMKTFYFGEVTGNLHIVLLTGYDEEKKVFYINDPAIKDLTEVSYQQFEQVYNSMKFAVAVGD